MKSQFTASLALGAALLLVGPAAAQTSSPATPTEPTAPTAQPAPPAAGMGYGYGRMGRGMGPGAGRGMMRGRGAGLGGCGMMGGIALGHGMTMMRYPDGTLAFLKTELKIKDSQSKEWDAFAHALRISAESNQKMRAQHWNSPRPQTLKAWLERREQRTAMQLETMRHISAALLPLYDSLDAKQKQTADALFMSCGRMGMGRGMGRGMGPWNTPSDDGDE